MTSFGVTCCAVLRTSSNLYLHNCKAQKVATEPYDGRSDGGSGRSGDESQHRAERRQPRAAHDELVLQRDEQPCDRTAYAFTACTCGEIYAQAELLLVVIVTHAKHPQSDPGL